MATMLKDCPICEKKAVLNVFSSPNCRNCGYKWKDYTDFRDMYLGRTPPPPAYKGKWIMLGSDEEELEEVKTDDYVASGRFAEEIQDLVDTATKKGVSKGERDRTLLIGREVGRIGMDATMEGKSPKETLDEIYVFITNMMNDEMEKFEAEREGRSE